MKESKNIFGEPLKTCSKDPVTGFYRDGCCNTGSDDRGWHVVCVVMTEEFLKFSKARGNDLTTPMPQYHFPGLKTGDKWCLCAIRWREAYDAGMAPEVVLEATHEHALNYVSIEQLIEYAYREKEG